MAITQWGTVIYIEQELGQWPSCKDYVITNNKNLNTGKLLYLFIPTKYINMEGVVDENLTYSPLTLSKVLHDAPSLSVTLPPPFIV